MTEAYVVVDSRANLEEESEVYYLGEYIMIGYQYIYQPWSNSTTSVLTFPQGAVVELDQG